METALAKGMDQSDAWNATSVEWVRAAKVCVIVSYPSHASHMILFASGTLSPFSAADVCQSSPDDRYVSQ